MFDADWWANYVPEPGGSDRDLDLDGIAGFLGMRFDVPPEVADKAAVRAARGVFNPAIGMYVDRETGEPLP